MAKDKKEMKKAITFIVSIFLASLNAGLLSFMYNGCGAINARLLIVTVTANMIIIGLWAFNNVKRYS